VPAFFQKSGYNFVKPKSMMILPCLEFSSENKTKGSLLELYAKILNSSFGMDSG